jgi:membrane protein DedA with SNARE-associated domain
MKRLGLVISTVGTLVAVFFPPYLFLGSRHWGFILTTLVSLFGNSVRVYDKIDVSMLTLELVLINAIGIALIVFGRRR